MKEKIKKIVALLSICCLFFSIVACEKDKPNSTNSSSNGTNSSITKEKLLGDIIPEPSIDYDIINASEESVYLEVSNASENDFRNYVESCKPYGFDGYIKSATMPDLYFMEYNDENYYLEVRFEEEEQEFSVYIRCPN